MALDTPHGIIMIDDRIGVEEALEPTETLAFSQKLNAALPFHSLPDPHELAEHFPLCRKKIEFVKKSRQDVCSILDGHDDRILLIVGPCSVHDSESTLEYASKLKDLVQATSHKFFILMRFYFEKPRTAVGWKGFVSDPFLDGSCNISAGLQMTRRLLLELADLEIPVATEFLDPLSLHYFSDLVTWGCVGARTVESQLHRQMASGMSMPVAFKNTTGGDVKAAIHGVLSASQPHTYPSYDSRGRLITMRTKGNPYSHIVLRGGKNKPNYDSESINEALEHLKRFSLPKRVIVDCSHGNSGRDYQRQPGVFKSVIEQIALGNTSIKGLLLESHINQGAQPFPEKGSSLKYAVSVTDSCLGWQETYQLILWAGGRLSLCKP